MNYKELMASIGAILMGIVVGAALSVGMDALLEATLLPGLTNPQPENAFIYFYPALYRTLFTILGGYVTARLAPYRPMSHAIFLGMIGILANGLGALSMWDAVTAHWYPVFLTVTALPATWLGAFFVKSSPEPISN